MYVIKFKTNQILLIKLATGLYWQLSYLLNERASFDMDYLEVLPESKTLKTHKLLHH